MEIGDWQATRELNDIYREIRALGLETNLAELEAFGFTVIEDALDPQLTKELREAVLRTAEDFTGRRLDLDAETEFESLRYVPFLLFRDPVFKQSVLNPRPLALVTYLLGKSCVLSSLGSHVKGPGGPGLLLHSDQSNGIPQPFTPASQTANCNYALTDYTEEKGAFAVVPGSHRHLRQPTRSEVGLEGEHRNPGVVPIEVPAGAAIVWHGATWHGSFPRKVPGLRINLSNFFCRPHLMPQEDFRHHVPAGFVEADDDPRLARLLGLELAHGWTTEGPTKPFAPQRSWHS
jgi:ectoine hydroxylase-related dioxygenase (phytanoyl-CoA dioxygenase family)